MEPSDTKAQRPLRAVGRGTAAVFFVCAVLLAWYLMMLVHELGHVLAAMVSGGRVAGSPRSTLAMCLGLAVVLIAMLA